MRTIKRLDKYVSIDLIFSLFFNEKDAVILESSLKNKLGRYSIIGRQAYMKVVKKDNLMINDELCEEDFMSFMGNYLKLNSESNTTELPIVNGAIGYISYDFDRVQSLALPKCVFIFYDQFIIEDHEEKEIYLIANGKLKDSAVSIKELQGKIDTIQINPLTYNDKSDITIKYNFTREEYKKAVSSMIQYIIEGDIYIANMTQRLDIISERSPYEVYSRLRKNNPAPFSAYMNYKDFQIVCASPERFLKMKNQVITTRPIKGTRKRGATEEEDKLLLQELVNSGKDRSELLMIVDLERNDLNRVCIPGSVKVNELFTIESYATVHHLVSDISGVLQPGLTAVDLLEATFPGGSITGAPKIRAMEIIDELERGKRGIYTGCIGYISLNGDCDFNIVIRTAIHQNGSYSLGVGGGITFESDLDFEHEETLQKAKAIIEALS